MPPRLCFRACCLLSAVFASITSFAVDELPRIELVNNQPFSIRMPLEVIQTSLGEDNWRTSNGQNIQSNGSNVIFIASVESKSRQSISLQPGTSPAKPALVVSAVTNGVALSYVGRELGILEWDIVLREVKRKGADTETTESTRADFDLN